MFSSLAGMLIQTQLQLWVSSGKGAQLSETDCRQEMSLTLAVCMGPGFGTYLHY